MTTARGDFSFTAIGFVQSPFKDRFGVPRQPGLAKAATGIIKLNPDPDLVTAIQSLEEFSHLWIVFVFHDHGGNKWKPSIRPPRLGGRRKVGVLSSRSPHRPNPIGISAVKIVKIDCAAMGGAEITVEGIDLIDGTPVLDIKPYIAYADSISDTNPGWASATIQKYPVQFSNDAEKFLATVRDAEIRDLIFEIIELDPRPAFQKREIPVEAESSQGKQFGIAILEYEVKYEIQGGGFLVNSVSPSPKS